MVCARDRGKSMNLLSEWIAVISSGPLVQLDNNNHERSSASWGLGNMFLKRRCVSKKVENVEDMADCMSVLDLPELALEGILARLPAASLRHMAGVCQELRKRCQSDHLWQHLFESKWARIVGPSAFREWQRHLIAQAEQGPVVERPARPWGWPLSCLWPFSWLNVPSQPTSVTPPPNSLMAWYWALESGSFWFPAQVYNREVGALWLCYVVVSMFALHCIVVLGVLYSLPPRWLLL